MNEGAGAVMEVEDLLYFMLPIFLCGYIYVVFRGTFWLIDRLTVWEKRISDLWFMFLVGVVLGLLGVGFTFSFTGNVWGGLLPLFWVFLAVSFIFILLFAVTAVRKLVHCWVIMVGFAIPLALFLCFNHSINAVIGAVIVTCWVVGALAITCLVELREKGRSWRRGERGNFYGCNDER